MSIRDTKTYKENAAKFKEGKVCEWCSSSIDLYVHHPQELFPTPKEIRNLMYTIAYSKFKDHYEQQQIKNGKSFETGRHKHEGCTFYHPISTQHKFEYDISTEIIQYKLPTPTKKDREQFKLKYNKFLEDNNVKSQIEADIKEADKRYVSLEGAVVICKRCHHATHKDMDLCPICKEKYKKKEYQTCFDCLPQKKKTEIEEFKNFEKQWSNHK